MSVTVRCDNVSVNLDDTVLLPATSLDLASPSLVALTGPNGAGKTTLLKVLGGRQLPTDGSCLINNQAPYELDPRFRAAVASLIDSPPLARDLMLIEQLALVQVTWGTTQEQAFRCAECLLERLTIGDLRHRFTYELSAGQLQLFALALTLSRPFDLLLLDEPERHLDGDRIQAVLELLNEHVQRGALVIAATHRDAVVQRSSSRINLNASNRT